MRIKEFSASFRNEAKIGLPDITSHRFCVLADSHYNFTTSTQKPRRNLEPRALYDTVEFIHKTIVRSVIEYLNLTILELTDIRSKHGLYLLKIELNLQPYDISAREIDVVGVNLRFMI